MPISIALILTNVSFIKMQLYKPRLLFTIVQSLLIGLVFSFYMLKILIDILQFFGALHNINKTFLGMTILAFGNALPDFITQI